MNVSKLRKKILQMAFSGQLIPNDGKQLFSDIKEKYDGIRNDLINQKKIKKDKLDDDITDDEKIYKSPTNWVWDRLGNIGSWGAGATPLRSNEDYYNNGTIAWLKTGELNDGYINNTEEKITEKALKECSLKFVHPGDVMIAMYGATIGKLGISEIELTTNQACCSCNIYYGIESKYLFYYLLSLRDYFINAGIGGAQPNISREIIINTPICIPSIEYQKELCEKIDRIFELINELEKSIGRVQKLKEKLKILIFDKAIHGELIKSNPLDKQIDVFKIESEFRNRHNLKKDKKVMEINLNDVPYSIPQNWIWVRLGNLGIYKKGPFGSSLTKSMFIPDGEDAIKVYEQQNAIKKDYALGDYYISRKKYESMKSFSVEPNDIIVSCAGTIGETYVMPKEARVGIINQALMKITLFDNNYKDFFLLYFDYVLKKEANEKGKGTAIKNIPPFDILKNMYIPLPPFEEQEKILNRVNSLISLINQV